MLEDQDCSIFLVIAGSTSAGGCMDVYADLVRYNMVDCIVATGATIVDMDFFEGLGFKHYQALEIPDDDTLRSLYIDRIYDTYIDEEELQHSTTRSTRSPNELEPQGPIPAARSSARWASASSSNGKKDELARPARLRARRADLLPGVLRLLGRASGWSSTRSSG